MIQPREYIEFAYKKAIKFGYIEPEEKLDESDIEELCDAVETKISLSVAQDFAEREMVNFFEWVEENFHSWTEENVHKHSPMRYQGENIPIYTTTELIPLYNKKDV